MPAADYSGHQYSIRRPLEVENASLEQCFYAKKGHICILQQHLRAWEGLQPSQASDSLIYFSSKA